MMLLLALLVGCFAVAQSDTTVQEFLANHKTLAQRYYTDILFATWEYRLNMTDSTSQNIAKARARYNEHEAEAARNASLLNATLVNITDNERQQLFDGTSYPYDDEEGGNATDPWSKFDSTVSEMLRIYSSAKVCLPGKDECLPLNPNLTEIMGTSRDYYLLLDVWQRWRDATGAKIRGLYPQYVEQGNDVVQPGFPDRGASWRARYRSRTFEKDIRFLYNQVRPLYEHLHAYTRRHLMTEYGKDKFPKSGQIPAHILGDMSAIEWSKLFSRMVPFKDKPALDVTEEMRRQNYTVRRIFEMADGFFTSLGFEPMNEDFWNYSVFEYPADGRDMDCHPEAWDFGNGKDWRFKGCLTVDHLSISLAHHEMGHIVYFMQYRNLPKEYRWAPNYGFHEGVGDAVALSSMTPKRLNALGLTPQLANDTEMDLNFLMRMALEKIPVFPITYIVDQWRWNVFRGDTKPRDYNKDWWDLTCRYQGLSAPIVRSENDLDIAAIYHVARDRTYIKYFVSYILQFQFFKAMCDAAGHVGPLYTCDIYNSTEAGTLLGNMMKKGTSQPWQDALKDMTGQSNLDAGPLMEYFEPLLKFLRKENGNEFGWHPRCPPPPPPPPPPREVKPSNTQESQTRRFFKRLKTLL